MHHLVLFAALVGCGDGPTSVGDPIDDPVDDPQVPPRGTDDVMTWIESGHYLAWSCEVERHPPRPGTGHGTNRICSNDTIVGSTGDGPFPVGAAAVKEVYSGDAIGLYAVYLKVDTAAGGESWYWFEGNRSNVIANGEGDATCTGCHSRAPRDFVYTVVAP
jgi:hypothetical protein